MRTFTDSADRTWTLGLTIGALKRVRDLLGVDLLALHEGEPPLLARLGSDLVLLVDLVFALVKPQADAAGVSDEQFAAGLAGDAVLRMREAFYAELIDFFRQAGQTHLARMLQIQDTVIADGVRRVVQRMDQLDLDELAEDLEVEAFGPSSTA